MSKIEKGIGDIKEKVLTTIHNYPGLSLRELSRELSISSSLMKYHLDQLLKEEKVRGVKDHKAKRFFLTTQKISEEDIKILHLLRNPVILEFIILFLKSYKESSIEENRGILRNSDLFKKLRFNSRGTISYYLNKLLEEKIIIKVSNISNSYCLLNPEQLEHVLTIYKPNPSVITNFSSLWSNFYKK